MTEVGSIHVGASADVTEAQQQLELLRSVLTEVGATATREAERLGSLGSATDGSGSQAAEAAGSFKGAASEASNMGR